MNFAEISNTFNLFNYREICQHKDLIEYNDDAMTS